MGTFERLMSSALLLVFVYLILSNATGATSVLRALTGGLSGLFRTLQAR